MWLQVSFTLDLLWGLWHKVVRFLVLSEDRKYHNREKEKEISTSKMPTVLLASERLLYPSSNRKSQVEVVAVLSVGQAPALHLSSVCQPASAWKGEEAGTADPGSCSPLLRRVCWTQQSKLSPHFQSTSLLLAALTLSSLGWLYLLGDPARHRPKVGVLCVGSCDSFSQCSESLFIPSLVTLWQY